LVLSQGVAGDLDERFGGDVPAAEAGYETEEGRGFFLAVEGGFDFLVEDSVVAIGDVAVDDGDFIRLLDMRPDFCEGEGPEDLDSQIYL